MDNWEDQKTGIDLSEFSEKNVIKIGVLNY